MALKLVNQAGNPLGQFDGLDGNGSTTGFLSLKGGEVVTFTSVVATSATDKAAQDSFDGYVIPNKRPVVTRVLTGSAATASRPLMLADDGISGYGTLFGSVVGGTVGQVSTGGAVLGPHTATGSGKVTCWHLPGVYAVSLDAVDTTATTGLVPTNTTGNLIPGKALYATANGLLTPDSSLNFDAASVTASIVGRFIDFETSESLVTTSSGLVGTLNPPDGAFSAGSRGLTFAVFYFNPSA
jgi:hypothetical protein